MDLEEVFRTVTCLMAELAKIAKEDREPTKKVLRLPSDCESVRSTLSGTHETNVHTNEATWKSCCTWWQLKLALFPTE